jgi:hypothetical protein
MHGYLSATVALSIAVNAPGLDCLEDESWFADLVRD